MRKKELLAAAADRRAAEHIQMAYRQMVKSEYNGRMIYRYRMMIDADVIECEGDRILQVSAWIHESSRGMLDIPNYKIFISRKEEKYITYDVREDTWKTAKIDYLACGVSDTEWDVYEGNNTTKTITRYLRGYKETGYEAILKFQKEKKKLALQRAHKRETDQIDAVMDMVPPIPKDFKAWAENIGLLESRYIYYQYKRNVTEGYCTHCRRIVPVRGARHNKKGKCLRCHSAVTFKSEGKTKQVMDSGLCQLLQRMKDGRFVLRQFEIRKNYRNYRNPEVNLYEERRRILDEYMNPQKGYTWEEYKNTGEIRWCNFSEGWQYMAMGRLYTYNLNKCLKDTDLRYVPLNTLLGRKHPKLDNVTMTLYRAERMNRVAEYFIKCRLYNLALEFLKGDRLEVAGWINVNADNIRDALMCTKEQLKIMQRYDGSSNLLRLISIANEKKVTLTEQQLVYMWKESINVEIIGYMKETTPHKLLRYIEGCIKNREVNGGTGRGDDREYLDYLNMRRQCGYDMTNSIILYPKNLIEAHDKMVLETNKREEEKRLVYVHKNFPEIELNFEHLNKQYAYEKDGYCIRPAQSAEEIVMEGRMLHHCVGGDNYLKKHNEGQTIILMLREIEKPEAPWYTVEYDPHRKEIRQWYAAYDKKPLADKVRKWLEKWKKELKKREQKSVAEEERIQIEI